MTKRTRKFVAAQQAALSLSINLSPIANQDDLYRTLELRGYFWDAESGEWVQAKHSTSMFEDDLGDGTGVFRLRAMMHPKDVARIMHILREALDTYSVEIIDESPPYQNRRGPGLRIYLTGKLADKEQ